LTAPISAASYQVFTPTVSAISVVSAAFPSRNILSIAGNQGF
jgi:hypothetical protein